MTPERWRQIEDVYHAALGRGPEQRAAFLAAACGADSDLRSEAESLLAEDGSRAEMLDRPVATPTTAPGTQFGPYRIEVSIGKGGMGEVWKARDSRLNRDVAIKISAQQFSGRFEREARAIAALNHPNICTIHDVGPNYLVMELIEGPTLAQRIKRGPVPLEEALAIAKQIANALEAAHEKGIVHRDLKPANIKIRPDGSVKVLDFGIAKACGEESAHDMQTMTAPGMMVGTPGYMPPEQVRGETVDKRADIWAFGVVLYEMVTGQRPFEGKTVSDTLASVMKDDPDWTRAPAKVRLLLRACLEKDPRRRLRDAGDVERLLDTEGLSDAPSQSRVGKAGWLAAGLFAVATATLAFIHFREKAPVPTAPMRFQIQAPGNATLTTLLKLSPDGRKLAFIAGSRLWVHFLDSGESRDLTAISGTPFWSPDNRYIGYSLQGKLRKIEATGGPPQTVTDLPGPWGGGTWNQDDVIVFAEQGGGLFRVPASGGASVAITALDPARRETLHAFPSFLPDGRHFVYCRRSSDSTKSAMYLGSVDAKPEQQSSKPLVNSNWHTECAATAETGVCDLLFVSGGTLMAQPFDTHRLELTGHATPIAEQLNDGRAFSSSANNILVFQPTPASDGQLTWYDRQGVAAGTAADPGDYQGLKLSPDGAQLAVTKGLRLDTSNIWLLDLSRGGAGTRFTFSSFIDNNPVWSPDGSSIVFSSNRDGPYNLYRKSANGAKEEEALLKSDEAKTATSWATDGRFLLYTVVQPGTKSHIWVLPLVGDKTKPVPFRVTEFNEHQAHFSPDGHWVAYTSDESGQDEVYVRSFSMNSAGTAVEAGAKWQVSSGRAQNPHWRNDGRELYYLSLTDRKLMAVDITSSPAFRAGKPQPLPLPAIPALGAWDYTADGKRFLVLGSKGGPQPYTVVLNWQAGLKK